MTVWPTVPFLEALVDQSGGNIKTLQSEYRESGRFPIVDQGKDLVGGYTDNPTSVCRSQPPVIVFGDHTRALKYVDFPFGMGADGVKVLHVREGFDPKFVFHYLRSLDIPSAGYSRHFKFLKEHPVLRPPLEEQRRIAEILDQADALRAKRREALAHLDDLTRSVFLDMFGDPTSNPMGWPLRPLASLSSIAGEYGANVAAVDYHPGLPRYVRITDVTDTGDLKSDAKAPGGTASNWARYTLAEGDLLFARSGATVGKTYLHSAENGPCVFAGYMIRFRLDPAFLSPVFAFHFTKTRSYASWVTARQRVVAQPNINAQQYGQDLLLPVPPLPRQHEFVRHVAGLDRVRASGQRQLTKLDSLFASLQSWAFVGEL